MVVLGLFFNHLEGNLFSLSLKRSAVFTPKGLIRTVSIFKACTLRTVFITSSPDIFFARIEDI